jgi:hypothetical protein
MSFKKSATPTLIKVPDVQDLFDNNDPFLEELHTSVDKENYKVEKVEIEVGTGNRS